MSHLNMNKMVDIQANDVYDSGELGIIPDEATYSSLETLRRYKHVKLEVAECLRVIRECLVVLNKKETAQRCGELMIKLAEDRFTLAVVGQFKRGKSSFLNSLIGRDLLPTSILPLTSAITVLKYGTKERLIINRKNLILPEEWPVSALSDFVTEKGNPGNQKQVDTANVELPLAFLKSGVEFVDTPGIGSAVESNTNTTYDFLPKCDAILFVTAVDAPMTKAELDFLRRMKEYVNKLFFVLNKTDLVTDDEQQEVVSFVKENIATITGMDNPKIFPLSTRLGFVAKKNKDGALYQQSGLRAVEKELAAFLSHEKTVFFLAAIIQKMIRLLDEAVPESESQFINADIAKNKPAGVQVSPQEATAQCDALKKRLSVLYKSLVDNDQLIDLRQHAAPDECVKQHKSPAFMMHAKQPLELQYHDVECPVCQYMVARVFDFFAKWQYQLRIDEPSRNQFADTLGFCPLHSWQLLSLASPQGASIGFPQWAQQLAGRLKKLRVDTPAGDAIKRLVTSSKDCRACNFQKQVEEEYLQQLAREIHADNGKERYSRSQGVCLRHLGMLVNRVSTKEDRQFLQSHAIRCFETDADDMRSYVMKSEALCRSLLTKEEDEAYLRTVIHIVGGKRVCNPWPEDVEI